MNVREVFLQGLAAVAAVALAAHAGTAGAAPAGSAPLKIGIIGAGHIGGTLARLWVAAGHEVLISSRHPEELRPLAQSLGPKARVGTPRDAALFGDVVLVSVPYGALPQIGRDLKVGLAGKIVLDTGNPYPQRDGDMALEARRVGTGVASPRYLPGVRLVRAFNAINSGDLASEAHRTGQPIAIPLAGDDPEALGARFFIMEYVAGETLARRLLRDAEYQHASQAAYSESVTGASADRPPSYRRSSPGRRRADRSDGRRTRAHPPRSTA